MYNIIIMNGVVYGDEIENLFNAQHESVLLTAANILKKCKFSKINSIATDSPFFIPLTDNVTHESMNMTSKDNSVLLELSNTVHFPKLLETIYKLLDSYNREFTYNQFTFMSINEVKKRLETFKKNNQHTVCDIAFSYYGMGHVIILAYDYKHKIFFMRLDGGANDYEREAHIKFITSYDTKMIPIIKQILPVTLFNVVNRTNIDDYSSFLVN